jgi:hypothetical protein
VAGILDRTDADREPVRPEPRGPHKVGTPLDEPHVQSVPIPGWKIGVAIFVVAAALYIGIGYWVTIEGRVVVFDALDRLTRAFLVWHNDPPKLAAIGFVFPPLTTMVLLPFAVVKPMATSLIALPLMSALFAAFALVMLDRTLARCDMPTLPRLGLLAVFALNPLWVFYAGNGMSEAVYAAFLAFSLYCFVSWYVTTEPRYLIGAGFGIALLLLTRYAFIIWALLLALLIGVALVRRRASRYEVEGSVIAYASPVIYFLALWILFNALIVGDPFGWVFTGDTAQQAVNAAGPLSAESVTFEEVSRRLLQLNAIVFPLAFAAVPALVAVFLVQRNDMALWLASFIVLGIVIIGVHAFAAQQEALLTLRDSFPMLVASFVGAGWIYRSWESFRPLVWAATLVMLLIGMVTAWVGMREYPFQSQEEAFTKAIATGETQEGGPSRGGFRVGVRNELQMAEAIKRLDLGPKANNRILTDNAQTYGVILLSGRPQLFFDRIAFGDTRWQQVLENPAGRVRYMLASTNPQAGDLIQQRYGQAVQGTDEQFTVAARNERYVLLRVPAAQQAQQEGATAQEPRSEAPTGAATPQAPPTAP